ncbi:hypothetical protein, partial [Komagataeibacter europaeus]|uniref:hypothetical protein n=1 Tax=Komagataeibacter europaeus TaxID=33995 RepID=UPI00222FAE98
MISHHNKETDETIRIKSRAGKRRPWKMLCPNRTVFFYIGIKNIDPKESSYLAVCRVGHFEGYKVEADP